MLEETERLILFIEHYVLEAHRQDSWHSMLTQVQMEGLERRRTFEDRCSSVYYKFYSGSSLKSGNDEIRERKI